MWNVFPVFFLVKIAIFILTLLFAIKIWLFSMPFSVSSVMSIFHYVTAEFIVVIWLLGVYGWKLFWRYTPFLKEILNRKVCPDIDGKWEGEIKSNYSDTDSVLAITKKIKVEIYANIFNIKMRLFTVDNYSESHTIFTKLKKEEDSDIFSLWYVYINKIEGYIETDERTHHGAAYLRVYWENDTAILKGIYWTDRNWRAKINTAGEIELRKSQ